MLETAVRAAARQGAGWVVTPELCVPGYMFAARIGDGWILPQPDRWMRRFCRLAAQLKLTVFLSHPERDPETRKLYNSVFVIDPAGRIIGRHSKVKALGGAEAWSSPGQRINPLEVDGVKVGVLVCADAYKNEVAGRLKEQGAQLFVSPAALGVPANAPPTGNGSSGRRTPACPSWYATAPASNPMNWTTTGRKASWPRTAAASCRPIATDR